MKILLAIVLLGIITTLYIQQRQIDRFTRKVSDLVQLLDAIHELIGQMMDEMAEEENNKTNRDARSVGDKAKRNGKAQA